MRGAHADVLGGLQDGEHMLQVFQARAISESSA
jgi:hypothetical protein